MGGGTVEARRLVRCAERAFEAALDVATAGRKVREFGRAVERVVRAERFSVIRSLGGHGIGRTIHEPLYEHTLIVTRGRPVLLTAA